MKAFRDRSQIAICNSTAMDKPLNDANRDGDDHVAEKKFGNVQALTMTIESRMSVLVLKH
jgi:hypothetical protein